MKRILETRTLAPGKLLRLAMPPIWKGEGDFGIVIDEKGEDDYVVSHQGMNILLMDAGLTDGLDHSGAGLQGVAGGHGVHPGRVLGAGLALRRAPVDY